MSSTQTVGQFVREALIAGRSRQDIKAALCEAGWSEREADEALAEFSDIDFTPPVPRPRPHFTARDTFIYALLFSALAFSAIYLINLVHALLDLWLVDAGDSGYVEVRASRIIRWAIAVLVLSVPLYLWMTRYTQRQIDQDQGHRRSLVRKWLTYIALFISALVFFVDGVYVIYSFLSGELTLRFILKAATVAFVTGAVFLFYIREVETKV